MAKFPMWLKISLAVVGFLVLAGAAFLKLLLEEPPEHARTPAIQARFASELETLRELADISPADGCSTERSPEDVMEHVEIMKPWWSAVDEVRDRFEDPAILGASIVAYCDGSTMSLGVKSHDEVEGAWSISYILAEEEGPSVSLWHVGNREFVRYEDRYTDSAGTSRGIRLLLDLERLGAG